MQITGNTTYANQYHNVTKSQTTGGMKNHQVFLKTPDMLYSGGNGTGLSFYIKYADGSTAEDPVMLAKGVDEHGQEFEQTIYVNKIDPANATIVEMRALEAYLGADKGGGLSSFSASAGNMGLHDRRNFVDMFQKDIKDQNTLGEHQKAMFYQKNMRLYMEFMNKEAAEEEVPDWKTSYAEIRDEIIEKIKRGETEESYQTGGTAFTQTEWKKLVEKFDKIIEEIQEEQEQRKEKAEEKREQKELIEKLFVDREELVLTQGTTDSDVREKEAVALKEKIFADLGIALQQAF